MADEQDILFKLKTEGETAGAESVKKAISEVGDVAENVGKTSDAAVDETSAKLEELRKRAEALRKDTDDYHDSQKQLNTTLNLSRAAMVGVGTGGAIVAKIFKEIGAAINSIDIDHLRQLNAEMAQQVEEVQAWAGVLENPIEGIQRLLSGESLAEAFGATNEQLRLNAENAARTAKAIAQSRLDAATENQEKIKIAYGFETRELIKQREELERIITLRNQLASLATERAGQEVEAAQVRGGDVELAKSNELAVRLQQGLQELGGNLEQAEAARRTSQAQFNEAVARYNQGVVDGLQKLDPDALGKLAEDVDSAQSLLEKANAALADQKKIFEVSKTNLLNSVETELAELETSGTDIVSKGAQKVRDNVYEAIKREYESLGRDTTQAISNSFSGLKEVQKKTNDGIAANTGELIGLVNALQQTIAFQGRQIDDLKLRVASIPNNF